ncbi:uncharacterized protein LOC143230737 isoform X1 [Tachypleus tridentatus]|uniref:uncharacterized protein LOC143230737 isoform X1 n=1 Tax=Tachypleus tridentatus TaxID=6853 RepID=UPI003FD262A6
MSVFSVWNQDYFEDSSSQKTTKMKTFHLAVLVCVLMVVTANSQESRTAPNAYGLFQRSSSSPTKLQHKEINWGNCPQLKPTTEQQEKKQQVISECLKKIPPPKPEDNPSAEELEKHRTDITTCALETDGWFDENGKYKYSKAEAEIEQKGLETELLKKMKEEHSSCKDKAEQKFSEDNVYQVQFYQECMDYSISKICEIEVVPQSTNKSETEE